MADKDVASPERSREALRKALMAIEPFALDAAVREDPELARELSLARYNILMGAAALAGSLSDYVSSLTEEERAALISEAMAALDGAKLAGSANSVTSALLKLRDEKAPIEEPLSLAVKEVMEKTDFGKVREAFEWYCEVTTALGSEAIEIMNGNPVAAANILAMMPTLANTFIRLFTKMVDSMELPDEILASALFNMIEELDAEAIGRGLTGLARQANSLHRGNKVLGGEEPRFRAVFSGFTARMMDEMDPAEVAGMFVAIAEDIEVMAGVFAGIVARDDELVLLSARTKAALANTIARTLAAVLSEMCKVPASTWRKTGETFRESLDTAEVGRALNAWVELGLAMRAADPELDSDVLSGVLSRVDFEKLEELMGGTVSDLVRATGSTPSLMKALEPERMGRRVNDWLKSFNDSVDSPAAVREYVARMMSAVDTAELKAASSKFVGGMTEGMLASAEKGEVLLKTYASAAFSVVRFLIRMAAGRLRGMREGR